MGIKIKANEISDARRLDFDQIQDLIAGECLSEPARNQAVQLRPLFDYKTVAGLQEENEECRKLLEEGIQIPEYAYPDMDEITDRLQVDGFIPEQGLWKQLIRTVKDSDLLIRSLRRQMAKAPRLAASCDLAEIPAELQARLEQVFDEEGEILDRASPELNRLRKQKIDEQSRLRRKLDSSLKAAVAAGYSPADAGITIRNGRLVIPVLAEHKRRVKGFIHDESATGQTVYTEPEEALESNNAIREIQFAENREIQRILLELSAFLRPYHAALREAGRLLCRIDLIRAKCRFGQKTGCHFPAHHAGPAFFLTDARHPLLLLSHRKKNLPLVPLKIWLSDEKRVLVISGPNAGGKSVCLKTVGLLQMMWQSGIPVPVGEGSKMGFFRNIMADIGDQQSLENDLSTYSSHLANMKRMLELAGPESLLLLDEFGNGTDPALGGPIAEAVLEALCHKKVFAIVNTHYTNLKNFAGRHPSCENAAMKFSPEKMEALFQLEIGQPGSSFALEIAEKAGLPKAVLNQARHKTGAKKINLDQLLSTAEKEKQAAETRIKELRDREQIVRRLEADFKEKSERLEKDRKAILNQAKAEASHLLEDANRRLEEAIRQIRESQAEKSLTQKLRLEIQELREEVRPDESIQAVVKAKKAERQEEKPIEVLGGEIKESDLVRIKGSESSGRVRRIKGKQAEVEFGEILSSIRLDKLERISRLREEKQQRKISGLNLSEKTMEFNSQLDIRGLRADEALRSLEAWLDEALLTGRSELSVLHGKGNGILRELIRKQLRIYPKVSEIRDEHADRGGAGITLFRLKAD